jgi:hypothetical protein
LQQQTRAASIVEVIRRAYSLYRVVAQHYQNGGKLIFRHADGSEETVRLVEFEGINNSGKK